MSNKKRNHDGTLGFGLNITGKSSNPFSMNTSQSGKSAKESLAQVEQPTKSQDFEHTGQAMPVILPRNYFRPFGTDSLDLRNLIDVPANTVNQTYFEFKAPKSSNVVITHYAVFTDILLAQNVEFIPRVNGNRVLRYHGDPNNNFRINLSVSVDLSGNALIPCEILLQAGQTLSWAFSNNSGAPAPMGVRIVGYVDSITKSSGTNFGG